MGLTRKSVFFFEGQSWFKFNSFGLALGTNLKFYTIVAKGLKVKVREFLGLNPTFVGITEQKRNSPQKVKQASRISIIFLFVQVRKQPRKISQRLSGKLYLCMYIKESPPPRLFLPLSLLVHKHRYCITPTSPKLVCKY